MASSVNSRTLLPPAGTIVATLEAAVAHWAGADGRTQMRDVRCASFRALARLSAPRARRPRT